MSKQNRAGEPPAQEEAGARPSLPTAGVNVTVNFYSYFKDLAGCRQANEAMRPGSTVGDLLDRVFARFPRLESSRRSVLVAVGLDYQPRTYVLREGDEISIFPPVQGG